MNSIYELNFLKRKNAAKVLNFFFNISKVSFVIHNSVIPCKKTTACSQPV